MSSAYQVHLPYAGELTLAISQQPLSDGKRGCWKGSGRSSPWMIDLLPHHYDLGSDFSHASMWLWCRCYLSFHLDDPLASGLCSSKQQRAWRENMGLLSLILTPMAGVGFLTFAFTEAMCGTPATRSPTRGIVFRVCPLLSAAIVMTSLTLGPLPQRDSTALSIP